MFAFGLLRHGGRDVKHPLTILLEVLHDDAVAILRMKLPMPDHGYNPPIMENQMDKKMENAMGTLI